MTIVRGRIVMKEGKVVESNGDLSQNECMKVGEVVNEEVRYVK